MKTKFPRNGAAAKRITVKGKRMVILNESEFDRLLRKADEFEPLLPEPLPNGNYPAAEYLRASLAIKILRHRRKLGMTQAELARRAGIRLESLNRIELNHVEPSIRTVEKIDRALRAAETESASPTAKSK
jgi:DNA-binding XRE family transcriptional regulator